jgi:hypothetical protein
MELRSGRLVTVMLHRHGVALQWKVGNVECALNLGQHKMMETLCSRKKSCGHGKAVGHLGGTAGVIPRTVPFTVPVADHWTQFRGEGDRGSRDFPCISGTAARVQQQPKQRHASFPFDTKKSQ